MTALSGAVGLNTFGEMLVVFVVFSGVLYFYDSRQFQLNNFQVRTLPGVSIN
jgi:hypothetical protein